MTIEIYLNIASTICLVAAIYRQAVILAQVKKRDPHMTSKILFPIFNVSVLIGMWLPFFHLAWASAYFFLVSAGIAAWTYWNNAIKKLWIKLFNKNRTK